MQVTRNRVAKLEQRVNAPHLAGKLVVVRGGATDAEVTGLLKASGIDEANPAHTIVVFRTFCEDKAGGESPFPTEPEILYVMDKK